MAGDDFDESDAPPPVPKPDTDSDFQIEGNDDPDSASDLDKRRESQKVSGHQQGRSLDTSEK